MSGWRAELHFGAAEVLIPAIGFLNDNDIAVRDDLQMVIYYHLLLDEHEILSANGVPAESLHTGQAAMASLSDEAVEELQLIFPDAPFFAQGQKTARPVARRQDAIAIAAMVA